MKTGGTAQIGFDPQIMDGRVRRPRVPGDISFGPVGRAVVEDDDAVGRHRLVHHRLDASGEKLAAIISADHPKNLVHALASATPGCAALSSAVTRLVS